MSASTLCVDGGRRISADTRYLTIDSAIEVGAWSRRTLFATHDLEFLATLIAEGGTDDFKYPVTFGGKPSEFEAVDLSTMEAVKLDGARMSDDRTSAWTVLSSSGNLPDNPGDDRVSRRDDGKGVVAFALADGATGCGYGGAAADAAIAVFETVVLPATARDCATVVDAADSSVRGLLGGEGDTTLVVFSVEGMRVRGASVGDSRLVAFDDHAFNGVSDDLTAAQHRKPRVGSGCMAVEFERSFERTTMLVAASDGLWDFVRSEEITRTVHHNLYSAPACVNELERLVRLVNEDRLPDDLSIVCVRLADDDGDDD
jgi:serine/threonine protein phosphatase PrpC